MLSLLNLLNHLDFNTTVRVMESAFGDQVLYEGLVRTKDELVLKPIWHDPVLLVRPDYEAKVIVIFMFEKEDKV